MTRNAVICFSSDLPGSPLSSINGFFQPWTSANNTGNKVSMISMEESLLVMMTMMVITVIMMMMVMTTITIKEIRIE